MNPPRDMELWCRSGQLQGICCGPAHVTYSYPTLTALRVCALETSTYATGFECRHRWLGRETCPLRFCFGSASVAQEHSTALFKPHRASGLSGIRWLVRVPYPRTGFTKQHGLRTQLFGMASSQACTPAMRRPLHQGNCACAVHQSGGRVRFGCARRDAHFQQF